MFNEIIHQLQSGTNSDRVLDVQAEIEVLDDGTIGTGRNPLIFDSNRDVCRDICKCDGVCDCNSSCNPRSYPCVAE